MSMFQKATRQKVKLKIAITGPSGSGKTYSSLMLAKGLGSKIAVIDTENGSAALYESVADFDVMTMSPPYTVAKYLAGIEAAVSEGYEVLVIDSLTHAWAAEGGLLQKKEALDARGGNSYTNWAGITKEHEAFKAKILSADVHIIATIRSKQDYVLETGNNGKTAPRKVGLAPVQREGIEYEFTTVFDVAMDHNTAVSKDRTGLFDGKIFTITPDTGKQFLGWLSSAADAPVPATEVKSETTTPTPTLSVAPDPGPEPERNKNWCDTCDVSLILSQNVPAWYCPNYKDKAGGKKHGYRQIKKDEWEQLKNN